MRNVGTPYPRLMSQAGETVRHTVGGVGLRVRKKRRPSCNGMDMGCNITQPERELTSGRCPVV